MTKKIEKACKDAQQSMRDHLSTMNVDVPLIRLMINESLDQMGEIFGTGLDEESLSAAFMATLAASARLWGPLCKKHGAAPQAAWVHFNKTTEAQIGADFALLLCGSSEYRCITIQAKRIKGEHSRKQTLRRGDLSAAEQIIADGDLAAMLKVGTDHAPEGSQRWQLAKFIQLSNDIGVHKLEHGQVQFAYAFWHDDGTAPSARELKDIVTELSAKYKEAEEDLVYGELSQSVKIDRSKTLRTYLLNASIGLGDAESKVSYTDEINTLLSVLAKHCSGVAVVNMSGTGLTYDKSKAALSSPPILAVKN